MNKYEKNNTAQHTFWIAYADLMTNLFFIFLVLFVIFYIPSIKKQKEAQKYTDTLNKLKNELQKKTDTLNKFRTIQDNIEKLKENNKLEYNQEYKRFELKKPIHFLENQASIVNQEDQEYLLNVGRDIIKLVEELNNTNKDVQYVLIIEGMASADGSPINEELSFRRALSVYNLWKRDKELEKKIQRLNNNKICKFQIVGSGQDDRGWGRIHSTEKYYEDQKIVIYLLPSINYNQETKKVNKKETLYGYEKDVKYKKQSTYNNQEKTKYYDNLEEREPIKDCNNNNATKYKYERHKKYNENKYTIFDITKGKEINTEKYDFVETCHYNHYVKVYLNGESFFLNLEDGIKINANKR